LKGLERPWYALVDDRVAPTRETEAEASFLAAITNAHCSQPEELVNYFCTRALAQSRHVDQWMLNYVELQTQSSVPPRMSETEEQMWKTGSPLMRNLLRLNRRRLDRLLLNVTIQALEEAGIDARRRVERLCLEEHSVTRSQTDLLDYYYLSAVDQPHELAWLHQGEMHRPEAEYYRAYWPESRFMFVGEAGCAVHLNLTCRLPKPTPRQTVIGIAVNGRPQLKITVGSAWGSWDIDLPADAVRDGLNEIAINWPMPEFETAPALEKARLKLIERKFPDFFPVFGEIHSFTASDARRFSTLAVVEQVESSMVEVA